MIKGKKHFADQKQRKLVTIDSEKLYCMDFYDAYFDFNTVSLKLPGFTLSALKYWDGQPLRFVARSRDRSTVFFAVIFELLERSKLGLSPRDSASAPPDDVVVDDDCPVLEDCPPSVTNT